MNINKHNYEAFFLDYHEGNLTPQQVADLLLFIDQHPELKEEFESFENVTIEDYSSIVFESKSELKKEITVENKDEYFIRSVENTLTSADSKLLKDYIKQHPQYLQEFELFQKTKLSHDNAIIFENKEVLKQISISADDLMIASVEGLLTSKEEKAFYQRLSTDQKMQNDLSLYKQTRLVADASIIFENKNELKQKRRKAIPLFYYVALAASVLLLFGLFYIFNNDPAEQKLATNKYPEIKDHTAKVTDQKLSNKVEKKTLSSDKNISFAKRSNVKKEDIITNENDQLQNSSANNESIANNQDKKIDNQPAVIKELQIVNNEQPSVNEKTSTNQQLTTSNHTQPDEFLSIREIVAAKVKQKTLDADVLAAEKKNGKFKKISGWDVVQIIAKGASKLTGKKVEAKPTYNEEGEVTAYALAAGGFQFSRGK